MSADPPEARPRGLDEMNAAELRAWWTAAGRTEADRYCAFAETVALLQNLQRADEIHRVTVARLLGMDDPRDRMTEALVVGRTLQESDARYAEMNAHIHATPLAPGTPPCKRACVLRDRPFE